MALIKHLADLDLNKNQLLNAVVQNLGSHPASPKGGQIYWSTTDETLYIYSIAVTDWVDLGDNGITNLGYVPATNQGTLTSDSGDNATIPATDATNAGLFLAIEKTKLANIEALADVTDTVNVTAAGALMDSEITDLIGIKSVNISTLQVKPSEGAFANGDKTKLDGIEAGSQANVDDILTTLGLAANILKYTDESGVATDLDLSLYLDDTNLARLTSGSLDSATGIATFERDDASTFTIDMSAFLDAITLNDTLTSTSVTEGLTANQGRALKALIDSINSSNTGDEVQATTTIAGIAEIATQTEVNTGSDNQRIVTPLTLKNTLGITGTLSSTLTYSQLIGDATATSIVVTHNIGNQFVQAEVYEVADAMGQVECEVELTSTTATTLRFNVAPSLNALRVVIIG